MDEIKIDMAAVKPTIFSLALLAVEIIVIITTLRFVGVQWPQIPGSGLLRAL